MNEEWRIANSEFIIRYSIRHRRTIRHSILLLVTMATVLGGCRSTRVRIPLDSIPMADAVRIINGNIAKITGTLKASGSVDGYFTLSDGRRRSYHLDGILFYLAPSYVRFDLKVFGDRQFLFGSNTEYYWYYNKEEDAYHCGRRDEADDFAPDIPIRPDQMVDALGLTPISPERSSPVHPQRVQRIVRDYQQILFLLYDDQGDVALEKEYWFDRYAPRLVRRVIFRNADGVVTMESTLDDYRPLAKGGPLLPRTMTTVWASSDARMRFHVAKWALVEGVGPDSVQFAPPRECDGP